MKILIVEDEFANFIHLAKLLNDDGGIVIEGPIKSVKDVKKYLNNKNLDVDLILSDIRLPDGLVFDAFRAVSCEIPIIFTTAYVDYTLDAFKFNSIDYLLKPIKREDLFDALERFTRRKTIASKLSVISQLSVQKYRQRFICSYKEKMMVVLVDDISHISTENKVTKIHTTDGHCYHIDNSMEELMEQLNPKDFMRISRQYIVHKQAVESYSVGWNRKITVNLVCYPNTPIIVGKEKLCVLKDWLTS